MRKYVSVFVLISVFVLSGCNGNLSDLEKDKMCAEMYYQASVKGKNVDPKYFNDSSWDFSYSSPFYSESDQTCYYFYSEYLLTEIQGQDDRWVRSFYLFDSFKDSFVFSETYCNDESLCLNFEENLNFEESPREFYESIKIYRKL